jgi:hypothetical protein
MTHSSEYGTITIDLLIFGFVASTRISVAAVSAAAVVSRHTTTLTALPYSEPDSNTAELDEFGVFDSTEPCSNTALLLSTPMTGPGILGMRDAGRGFPFVAQIN